MRDLFNEQTRTGAWHGPMYPRVSPSGRSLAFSAVSQGVRDIWIHDFREDQLRRLTRLLSAWEPQWTPDARRIVFTSDTGGTRRLWWQAADGSGPAQVLVAADSVFTGHLSADGRVLVYATAGGNVWYVVLGGDNEPRPLLTTESRETMPRLSPDGRWIAFVADYSEPASYEIYVQPFPGPGKRVQISAEGGTEPVWAHDGRRLFYRAGGKVMAADLVLTPGLAVTSRRALFDDQFDGEMHHVNYDVTSDGRLVMVHQGTRKPEIVVVLNWIQELRARLASSAR